MLLRAHKPEVLASSARIFPYPDAGVPALERTVLAHSGSLLSHHCSVPCSWTDGSVSPLSALSLEHVVSGDRDLFKAVGHLRNFQGIKVRVLTFSFLLGNKVVATHRFGVGHHGRDELADSVLVFESELLVPPLEVRLLREFALLPALSLEKVEGSPVMLVDIEH